jgi:hypothetical protein
MSTAFDAERTVDALSPAIKERQLQCRSMRHGQQRWPTCRGAGVASGPLLLHPSMRAMFQGGFLRSRSWTSSLARDGRSWRAAKREVRVAKGRVFGRLEGLVKGKRKGKGKALAARPVLLARARVSLSSINGSNDDKPSYLLLGIYRRSDPGPPVSLPRASSRLLPCKTQLLLLDLT